MADVEKVKQGCKCCDHPLGERKCKGCPYAHFLTPYCNIHLAHDTLSVIEGLQAENKRLTEMVERIKPHAFNVDVDALCKDLV